MSESPYRELPLIDFDPLSPRQAKEDYFTLWATVRNALPALTDEQTAIVVAIVVDTCPYCHENSRPCHCSLDD